MKYNFKQMLCLMTFAFVVSLSISGVVLAQEITGSIIGTARDSSGAVVAGATVTITDPAKKQYRRANRTNE